MESVEMIEKAEKQLGIADHLLTQTLPLVGDTKLLLAVMENVHVSLLNGMNALLAYERERKEIPPFHDSFESRFNVFKLKVAGRCGFTPDEVQFVLDIKKISDAHKQSPMEFSRKDKFVICDEEYHIEKITVDDMKKYINKTRTILEKAKGTIR